MRQYLTVSSQQRGKTRWQHWGSNMDQGLIDDFLAMIREERSPSITGEDGLRSLEVALAAYRSAETAAPVKLPLVAAR
jgi:predicted dehydrogenase